MTLRRRLVAGLLVLSALGMLLSGLATTTVLRHFLYDRVDQQLVDALGPTDGDGARPRVAPDGDIVGGPYSRAARRTDTYVAVVNVSGSQVNALSLTNGGLLVDDARILPATMFHADQLRSKLADSEHGAEIWTASSSKTGRVRVIATDLGSGNVLIIGRSLHDVDSTIGRLILAEMLVGGAVLLVMGTLGIWAVRRELRPLDRMADTAGRIADGDLSARVDTADDKTEVGRLGTALNTMLTRIEEAFEVRRASEDRLRRFVADASHELRTPLTSIRGYAELFRRGAADRPEDLARAMSRIEGEAARMGLLVEDLLLLARLDQGRPLDLTEVDLARIAQDSVADARAVEPERPLNYEGPEHATALGDEVRLRQVVANLLANVRMHTPAETPCVVRLRPSEEVLRIEVADEGPGLSPEAAAVVFERFTRADEGRARAAGGVGLGLSIVAAIVEAHGGTVGVDTEPGQGATFWVQLPAA